MDQLAIHGGTPVRATPFPTSALGVSMYDEREAEALAAVVASKTPFRHYGVGTPHWADDFEAMCRDYFGRRFALAVSSGTGALFCAVAGLGVGPGDEVILPAFGWYSDALAVTNMGATPVYANVDETLGLDPDDFARKITKKTKAAIAIGFQGAAPDMDGIVSVARRFGVPIIEDVAQAFGGEYEGRKLGSIGEAAIASFQQNKMLCCGEGGLFLTDDEAIFARAARFHDLGMLRPVFASQVSEELHGDPSPDGRYAQYRMTEFQSAVMVTQMEKLDGILQACRNKSETIRAAFRDNPHFTFRHAEGDCGVGIFMLFPSREEAGTFNRCLEAEGIPTGAKSACRNLCPNIDTDSVTDRYVALPVGPQYTDADVGDVVAGIQKVLERLYA